MTIEDRDGQQAGLATTKPNRVLVKTALRRIAPILKFLRVAVKGWGQARKGAEAK